MVTKGLESTLDPKGAQISRDFGITSAKPSYENLFKEDRSAVMECYVGELEFDLHYGGPDKPWFNYVNLNDSRFGYEGMPLIGVAGLRKDLRANRGGDKLAVDLTSSMEIEKAYSQQMS